MDKKLIYVVDDDHLVLRVLDDFLSAEGHEVHTTDSGHAILVLCDQRIPDLIISDISMPKLDGLSLLAELRKMENAKNVPVIIHSGYSDQDILQKVKDLGAAYYLFSPFTNDDLRKIITQIFKTG